MLKINCVKKGKDIKKPINVQDGFAMFYVCSLKMHHYNTYSCTQQTKIKIQLSLIQEDSDGSQGF